MAGDHFTSSNNKIRAKAHRLLCLSVMQTDMIGVLIESVLALLLQFKLDAAQ